jgi:putative transposase
VIKVLVKEYPVAAVCRVLGWARSSYYYRPGEPDDEALRAAIQGVAGEWPTYGSRRVTAQLRRLGWTVNRKRVVPWPKNAIRAGIRWPFSITQEGYPF